MAFVACMLGSWFGSVYARGCPLSLSAVYITGSHMLNTIDDGLLLVLVMSWKKI